MGLSLSDNKYARSYNSMGGGDIFVIFENAVVGTVTGVTWNITREVAPVYVLGHVDPVGVSKGKRGIAGSITGMVFDRWAFYDLAWGSDPFNPEPQRDYATYARKTGDILIPGGLSYLSPSQIESIYGINPTTDEGSVSSYGGARIWTVENWKQMLGWKESKVLYSDQMLPMDVTVAGINEAGNMTTMRLFGITLISSGSGISIDDVTLEEQYTFMAHAVVPFLPAYTAGQTPEGADHVSLMDRAFGVGRLPNPGSEQNTLGEIMALIQGSNDINTGSGSTGKKVPESAATA